MQKAKHMQMQWNQEVKTIGTNPRMNKERKASLIILIIQVAHWTKPKSGQAKCRKAKKQYKTGNCKQKGTQKTYGYSKNESTSVPGKWTKVTANKGGQGIQMQNVNHTHGEAKQNTEKEKQETFTRRSLQKQKSETKNKKSKHWAMNLRNTLKSKTKHTSWTKWKQLPPDIQLQGFGVVHELFLRHLARKLQGMFPVLTLSASWT